MRDHTIETAKEDVNFRLQYMNLFRDKKETEYNLPFTFAMMALCSFAVLIHMYNFRLGIVHFSAPEFEKRKQKNVLTCLCLGPFN